MEAHDQDPFADLMAADALPFPDQAMWLRYNYSSGAARTGLLTPDALAIVLRDQPLLRVRRPVGRLPAHA